MAGAALRGRLTPGRLTWLLGEVVEVADGPPGVRTIALDCPGWQGHLPGQHVDIRLTAEDGYQAQRSYSIAAPADGERVALTVERLDDGEVSPYLTDELRLGDRDRAARADRRLLRLGARRGRAAAPDRRAAAASCR